MGTKQQGGRKVKTTETVFDIVEALQKTFPMGVTELAEEVDLAPSTVHCHLSTLLEREYLVKRDGKYELSLKFTRLGRDIRFDKDVVSAATQTLPELATDTGEEAWLTVEENGHNVPLMKESADKGIRSVGMISAYTDIHNSGAGKAILAHLDDDRVEEIVLEKGLPPSTPNTVTEPEELYEELEQIRDQGYAFSNQERYEGVRGVFSPIVVGNRVYGSVGVAGPSNRLGGSLFREELPKRVMEASNEIELKLQYPKFDSGED